VFESTTTPMTIFELAPTKGGGEIFYIWEIENPSEFFSEADGDISEFLIKLDRGPDKTLETCGYTLVLERPEDPHKPESVTPPENPITIEVIQDTGQLESVEFYKIKDPVDTFGNDWGDTSAMYSAITSEKGEPLAKYDNVTRIQRSYGEL